MSDLPQQNTIIQYLADGVTDTYIVPFYTPIEPGGIPDLDVFTQLITAPAIPEDDIKVWNVDYIYTPNLDPITGGVITFLPGKIPPLSYVVTIARNVSASLDVEFSQAQTFSGITLDAALDKLLLISQQNKSYTLGRNLSYIVNTYLPENTLAANVQIPVLGSTQVWMDSANGIIAATLEQNPDVSTLRSELANEQPTTNGAALVGYYDSVNSSPTTVADQLTYLTGYVLASTPTGAMLDFAGTVAPAGFLGCDGSAVSRVTYSDLFAVLGETWGPGNGTTTFNLPDFRRCVAVGSGGSGTSVLGNAVGDTGGDETEALTDSLQLPAHTHATTGSTGNLNVSVANTAGIAPLNSVTFSQPAGGTADLPVTLAINLASTGASAPFSIMQPSAVVLKIIKT